MLPIDVTFDTGEETKGGRKRKKASLKTKYKAIHHGIPNKLKSNELFSRQQKKRQMGKKSILYTELFRVSECGKYLSVFSARFWVKLTSINK